MAKVLDDVIAAIKGFLAKAGRLFNHHMSRSEWHDTEGLLVHQNRALLFVVLYWPFLLQLVRICTPCYVRRPSMCQVPALGLEHGKILGAAGKLETTGLAFTAEGSLPSRRYDSF